MFIEALYLITKKVPEKYFTAVILGSDQGRKVYKKKLIRLVEQYRLQKHIYFIDIPFFYFYIMVYSLYTYRFSRS